MAVQSEVLEAALKELRKRREQLDHAIEVLEAETGVSPNTQAPASSGGEASHFTPRGEGVDILGKVYQGQFYGKSQTNAARELLNMAKRPLKTPILSDALMKSGMKVVTSSLYTAFKRSSDFVLVLPNTWGLKEWYPDGVKSMTVEKKPKRRERRKKNIQSTSDADSSKEQPKKGGRPGKTTEGVP